MTSYLALEGEVLSETRGGAQRDYVPDALGSTAALIDSSQTVTDSWTYRAYGETASRTGSTATPFAFVGTLGYYADSASRLYVRARHYRPAVGRWQTVDPLWPGESAYGYAEDRPTTWADPSGLLPDWNPRWMKNRANYNRFMGCVADAARELRECAGKDKVLLTQMMRCIAGCETSDPPSEKNPFITDHGLTFPTSAEGIGPCRLTRQNKYPRPDWESDYCANAWGGMSLLCRRGIHPWSPPTPSCTKRCLKKKYGVTWAPRG